MQAKMLVQIQMMMMMVHSSSCSLDVSGRSLSCDPDLDLLNWLLVNELI